jgi:methylglutaconyl-CoA hydratase
MSANPLLVRRDGAIDYVELNRPEVRNAFDERLIQELTSYAAGARQDQSLRAVVLSGAGPVFCAGADLAWMTRMAAYSQKENRRDAVVAADLFAALNDLPVPVIARIHGAALGGGTGLAAVADIAIAETSALFGLTEVKIGLVPSIIAPYVIAKIGESAARELFLTGRRFSATRALEIGLVHRVVGVDDLDKTVREYLDEILAAGPEAVAVAKQLIRDVLRGTDDEARALTIETIATRRASAEAQERMKQFLQKSTKNP